MSYPRNPKPLSEKFEAKYFVEPNTGCWFWLASTNGRKGYGKIAVDGKFCLAHRVSWELFRGPIPEGLAVLHSCDTPSCVSPYHLFLGTNFDNMQDCAAKGRLTQANGPGVKNRLAKLTDDLVRFIRSSPLTALELAQKLNISRNNVYYVRAGLTWKHV